MYLMFRQNITTRHIAKIAHKHFCFVFSELKKTRLASAAIVKSFTDHATKKYVSPSNKY
jgi:hypothetical protein